MRTDWTHSKLCSVRSGRSCSCRRSDHARFQSEHRQGARSRGAWWNLRAVFLPAARSRRASAHLSVAVCVMACHIIQPATGSSGVGLLSGWVDPRTSGGLRTRRKEPEVEAKGSERKRHRSSLAACHISCRCQSKDQCVKKELPAKDLSCAEPRKLPWLVIGHVIFADYIYLDMNAYRCCIISIRLSECCMM